MAKGVRSKGAGSSTMQRQTKKILQEGGLATSIEIVDYDEEGANKTINGIDVSNYKLTVKEAEFIVEYMNNGMNAVMAVKKVWGYTNTVAKGKAQAIVNNGRIFPVIQLLIKHSVNKSLQFSPALLMTNIQTWLQYDIRHFYDDNGDAIPLEQIPEDMRLLISGVEYTVNNRTGLKYVTYKLPDKFKALQELSSIVKFVQSISTGSPEEDTEAAMKRDNIFKRIRNYTPTEDEIDNYKQVNPSIEDIENDKEEG